MPPGDTETELPLIGTLDPIIEENLRQLFIAPLWYYYTGYHKYCTERSLVDLVRYMGRQVFERSGVTVKAILWTPLLTLYCILVIYGPWGIKTLLCRQLIHIVSLTHSATS